MTEHALVLITCGDREEAGRLARRLVEDALAAGAQMLPIASVYTWKGEVVDDDEWLVIAKTRADRFEAIRATVHEIHSYEVPPILMIDIEAADRSYLEWIDTGVGSSASGEGSNLPTPST